MGDHYVNIGRGSGSCTDPGLNMCQPALYFTLQPQLRPSLPPPNDDDENWTHPGSSSSVYDRPLMAFAIFTVVAGLMYTMPRLLGSRRRVKENSRRMGIRLAGASHSNLRSSDDRSSAVLFAMACRENEEPSSPLALVRGASQRSFSDASTCLNWLFSWDGRSYRLPCTLTYLRTRAVYDSIQNHLCVLVVPPPPT